jgi:hypothetical protein
MSEPEDEPSFEHGEAPPLRRSRGEAPAAPTEAVAAAEETIHAVNVAETLAGWHGVISRAVIAFSPLVFFR